MLGINLRWQYNNQRIVVLEARRNNMKYVAIEGNRATCHGTSEVVCLMLIMLKIQVIVCVNAASGDLSHHMLLKLFNQTNF